MKNMYGLGVLLLLLAACSMTSPPSVPRAEQSGSSAPLMQTQSAASNDPIGLIPADATPIKVGILLPLSGDSEMLGNAMLDAATLALYDEYMSVPSSQIKSQIVLVPKDTGNSANSAVAAAKAAINDGATFIVGPLFAQAVTAMKPLVKTHNVPVISFSNNRVVAEPNIYTFGFLPEQQILRIAEYAYLHGSHRAALLAPNDAYGQKVRDELSFLYSQRGGVLAPAELFSSNEANIDAAVARLNAAYTNTQEDRKFQAIFIADGGNNMRNIIKSMKKHQVDFSRIKLFGAGMWDDAALTKIPELSGTIFPGPPPVQSERFEQRFMAMYGYKAPRLSALSYDIVSLLARASMKNSANKINAATLSTKDGYVAPAGGLYRLMKDGTNERKLAIIEITPAGFKVIEPASKSFSEAGQ